MLHRSSRSQRWAVERPSALQAGIRNQSVASSQSTGEGARGNTATDDGQVSPVDQTYEGLGDQAAGRPCYDSTGEEPGNQLCFPVLGTREQSRFSIRQGSVSLVRTLIPGAITCVAWTKNTSATKWVSEKSVRMVVS